MHQKNYKVKGPWRIIYKHVHPLGHSLKAGGEGIETYRLIQVSFDDTEGKQKITSSVVAIRQPNDKEIIINTQSGSEYTFLVKEETDSLSSIEDLRHILQISEWWNSLNPEQHDQLYNADTQDQLDELMKRFGYP